MVDPFALADHPQPELPTAAPPAFTCLDGLNEAQRQAVEATDGPVLVLAGAGTGKTRVLTARLAHILATSRARPWQILAVTFTNKAAREMRERVASILNTSVEGWWVGTFHAIGARMLRQNAERLGLRREFTILDVDDQLRLMKQLLEAANIDAKRSPAKLFLALIGRWKDRGLTPAQVTASEGAAASDGVALKLYAAYQERLRLLNACDFGDLLLHNLTLFREDEECLAKYQRQFRYLLVDEYQDTNVAQYLWLRALAQQHHNICCVGDDDQSIYSWRGAEVGNILRFERDFPGAKVIRLELNYRSTPHILAAASGLIAHNKSRLGKTLWTPLAEGERVTVRGAWDGEDEARGVCEEIEDLRSAGHTLNSMAILVRAGFQTREFEERLVTIGMPYRMVGGVRFYERQEIRDAIAYFRVVVQPDDDLAFERILNVPKRGLGTASLRSLHMLARRDGRSLVAAATALVATDELRPQARAAVYRLINDLARWHGQLDTMAHPEVARLVLEESGYVEMWQRDRSPDAAGRLENLKELVGALAEFESMAGFLEHVSLVMDNDEAAADDKVTLMTVHAAKGLEFETVFLPGWEEGIFPNQRALEEGGGAALEEERRLAYVGLTRARKRAIVSYAARRLVYGSWQSANISRFVTEMPNENVTHYAPRGLVTGRPARHGGLGLGQDFGFAATPRQGAPRWSRPPLLEGKAERVAARPRPQQDFAPGQRVFHQKFGYGEVQAVDGETLTIAFEKAGTKTVIYSFVKAA